MRLDNAQLCVMLLNKPSNRHLSLGNNMTWHCALLSHYY